MGYVKFMTGELFEIPQNIQNGSQLHLLVKKVFPPEQKNLTLVLTNIQTGQPIYARSDALFDDNKDDLIIFAHYMLPPSLLYSDDDFSFGSLKKKKSRRKKTSRKRKSIAKTRKSKSKKK